MDLDHRLQKISHGVSVTDAIDSYMQELAGKGEVEDTEVALEGELLAIVELMFLMAAVDGEISEDELGQLRSSLEALADIRDAELAIDKTLDELAEKLADEGWKRRLEDAAGRIRTPEAKAFAFRLAAGVAFVDDFVAHAEAAAIDSVARALALPKDESQAIMREVHETLFGG
jgi:hypothetical protein